MFRLRIVTVDHYTSKPVPGIDDTYSDFRGREVSRVPVIRIFGVTEDGVKACLHVHGVYPYFYIPEAGNGGKMYEMASKINAAFNPITTAQKYRNDHVHRIESVKGIPFYGYHPEEKSFLKISMYTPYSIKNASDLLLEGKIMDQRLQPHFSHVPYILQFFIDYNLHGMNYIMLSKVTYRTGSFDRNILDPMTCCKLECDCSAADILNVNEDAICGGLGLIWEEEKERRRRMGKSSQPPPEISIPRNITPIQLRESKFLEDFNNIIDNEKDQGDTVDCEMTQDFSIYDFAKIAAELIERNKSSQPKIDLARTGFLDSDNEFSDDDNGHEDNHEMSMKLEDVLSQASFTERVDMSIPSTSNNVTNDFKVVEVESKIDKASQESWDEFEDDDEDFMHLLSQLDKTEEGSSQQTQCEDEFDDDDDVLCNCKTKSICCDLCCDHQSPTCRRRIPQIDGNEDLPGGSGRKKSSKKRKKFGYSLPCERRNKIADTLSSSKKRVARKVAGMRISISPTISEQELKRLCSVQVVIDDEPQPSTSKSSRKAKRNLSFCVEDERNQVVEGGTIAEGGLQNFVSKTSLDAIELATTSVAEPLSQNTIIVSDTEEAISPLPMNTEPTEDEIQVIDSEDEVSGIFGQEDSEVFSFHEYGSSQGSIRSLDSPGTPLLKSISDLPSSQEFKFSSQNSDAPIHSTPSRPRGLRKKLRLPDIAMMGDISCISSASQPLATIREESSLSPQKRTSSSRFKIFSADEYLRLNPPPMTQTNQGKLFRRRNVSCDSLIGGPAQSQSISFAVSSFGESAAETRRGVSSHEFQRITTFSLELHVETREGLRPDPEHDSIRAIFYSFMNDEPSDGDEAKIKTGIIIIDCNREFVDLNCSHPVINRRPIVASSGFKRTDVSVEYANDEVHLMLLLVDVIRKYDPEIILGYEIEMTSWSYLMDRSQVLNVNISAALSRLLQTDVKIEAKRDNYNLDHSFRANPLFHLQFPGRIVLNFWRILRREVTLNNYTYENCHFHILHERVPKYSFDVLTKWFNQDIQLSRSKVLDYYVQRTEGCLNMINKLGLIPKTSTLARVYGIQFSEVFSRGSQFRVESMMLRYAKRFNYIPVSPTPRQRTSMYAPEYVPLIMEPESKFYTDPVVVLDFQSLYPSMIIAYNYCYSTCLGRISQLGSGDTFSFGCSSLKIDKAELIKHRNLIHIAPNGAVFLKENARKGILPQMLKEILDTRIMVKNAMKENAASEAKSNSLHRLLDARQLALKLIANVTYGYTGANFSGRMPCVEIADAIVSKGKETLQRAIDSVHSNVEKWGGRVVYGDTDSLFILFERCSKEEAFKRGKEIAHKVTLENPEPVKLKFEKVYYPCVLQTKKRYIGFSYEDPSQKVGIFDAKGVETVRRDSCEATSKILEKSLRILFDTKDPENCKMYVLRQFQKLLSGKLSILRDFIFAKEYRGRDKYSQFARIPALEIAKKLTEKDPRAEPRRGERVPYVIVYGSPDQALYQLVRHPEELISDPSLKLNAVYYIERVLIPPLNRVFHLMSQDVFKWYEEMPRKTNVAKCNFFATRGKKMKNQTTISQYFVSSSCPSCQTKSGDQGICKSCSSDPQKTAVNLTNFIKETETKFRDTALICKICSDSPVIGDHNCTSIDCANLFRYSQSRRNLSNLNYYDDLLKRLTF